MPTPHPSLNDIRSSANNAKAKGDEEAYLKLMDFYNKVEREMYGGPAPKPTVIPERPAPRPPIREQLRIEDPSSTAMEFATGALRGVMGAADFVSGPYDLGSKAFGKYKPLLERGLYSGSPDSLTTKIAANVGEIGVQSIGVGGALRGGITGLSRLSTAFRGAGAEKATYSLWARLGNFLSRGSASTDAAAGVASGVSGPLFGELAVQTGLAGESQRGAAETVGEFVGPAASSMMIRGASAMRKPLSKLLSTANIPNQLAGLKPVEVYRGAYSSVKELIEAVNLGYSQPYSRSFLNKLDEVVTSQPLSTRELTSNQAVATWVAGAKQKSTPLTSKDIFNLLDGMRPFLSGSRGPNRDLAVQIENLAERFINNADDQIALLPGSRGDASRILRAAGFENPVAAHKAANSMYQRVKTFEAFESIVEEAAQSKNYAESLRRGFTSLLDGSHPQSTYLLPFQKSAIKQALSGNTLTEKALDALDNAFGFHSQDYIKIMSINALSNAAGVLGPGLGVLAAGGGMHLAGGVATGQIVITKTARAFANQALKSNLRFAKDFSMAGKDVDKIVRAWIRNTPQSIRNTDTGNIQLAMLLLASGAEHLPARQFPAYIRNSKSLSNTMYLWGRLIGMAEEEENTQRMVRGGGEGAPRMPSVAP